MFSILLYDTDEMLASAELAILTKEGHSVFPVKTDEEALSLLDQKHIDLCVVDTDIHGLAGNGFQFLKQVRADHPSLPVVFTTEKNLDDYIGALLRYDAGNVLLKPVPGDTLLNVVGKAVTGENLFGLQNCIKGMQDMRKIRLMDSRQIRPSMDKILDAAKEWGFSGIEAGTVRILLQEMMINALYHSHGKTKEKLDRSQIVLSNGKFVEAVYGHNGSKFGTAIIDYNGTLSRQTILKTLFDVAEQDRMMQAALQSPGAPINISDSGRGIDLLRKLSGEYYFNIRRKYMTEIVVIFDIHFQKDDPRSSLNIFEID
jgi:DNA-binding NarL/FixJ family response regulator